MTLSQALQDDLCLKLRMVGLPKAVVLPVVNQLVRQVAAEGPENVVKRLKVLKQAAVNHISGAEVSFPWVAHNRHGPKGPWRPIWQLLQKGGYKQQKRALNALMVYASFVFPKDNGPTKTQERKFLGSVQYDVAHVSDVNRKAGEAWRSGVFQEGLSRLKDTLMMRGWNPRSLKAHPDVWVFLGKHYGLLENGKPRAHDASRLERVLADFCGNPGMYSFHSFPAVKDFLGEVGEDYFSLTHPWNGTHLDWRTVDIPDVPIGTIGFSQEPGLKFRGFAAPNPVLQGALEPMKVKLLEALKALPWDCTHEQDKGVTAVQQWLSEGKTVFSVDLSDATNNFPLALQLEVLKKLRMSPEYIQLLKLVSRSPYRVSWKRNSNGENETVVWNVGQPLGSGPSFMSFALAHAAVALDAEAAAGVDAIDAGSTFRILGDDFVCCHPLVHSEYRKRLGLLSVPISEPKCLTSDVAGEFAGKLIMSDKVFHGFKYKSVSNRSFLDVIRSLGPQSLSEKFLTKEQYQYAMLVRELPEPFGLGFNPSGRPLQERYEEYLVLHEQLNAAKPVNKQFTEAELKNRVLYLMKESVWRYYPSDASKLREVAVQKPDPGVSLGDQLMALQRGVDRLLSGSLFQKGDPRPDPLQGWSKKALTKLAPIVSRVRQSQGKPETSDDTCSPGPSVFHEGQTSPEREVGIPPRPRPR